MEGAKKRIFGVFEAFFDLYAPQKRRKKDTSLDSAAYFGHLLAPPFALPFAAPFVSKILPQKRRKLRCRKNAAKSNEVSCLRRFCVAYKWPKMKKSQNPFTMSLGLNYNGAT